MTDHAPHAPHAPHALSHAELRMRGYVAVWLGLVVIVALEVQVAHAHLPVRLQLAGLLVLATIEAAVGLLYFMHLRYERRVLLWSVVVALLFVLLMLNQLWADAHRMLLLHR